VVETYRTPGSIPPNSSRDGGQFVEVGSSAGLDLKVRSININLTGGGTIDEVHK
jgi:hypothetical protein